MKSILIILHLGFVSIFFLFLSRANDFLTLGADKITLLLSTLFLSLHPDAVMWVDWISNANELLMVCLYVSGLLCFLRYIMDIHSSRNWLISSITLFLLSTLAKQQSMHFPLLLAMVLLMFKGRILPEKQRAIKNAILISCIIVTAHIVINYGIHFREHDIQFAFILGKKPFAIAGTALYLLFPIFGIELYQWFLIHTLYAAMVATVGVAAVLFFVGRKYYSRFVLILLFTAIIFFPRMMGAGGERINAVQLVWLCFAMVSISLVVRNRWIIHAGLAILVILLLGGSLNTVHRQINAERTIAAIVDSVNALHEKGRKPVYMLYSSPLLSWPQQFYFQRHKTFGTPDNIHFSGVVARPLLYDFGLPEKIYCEQTDSAISIIAAEPKEYFLDLNLRNKLMILRQTHISPFRGFQNIVYAVPEQIKNRNPLLVYFHDGNITTLKPLTE